jgi:hypothetical protein
MRYKNQFVLAGMAFAGLAGAQQPAGLTARELYYQVGATGQTVEKTTSVTTSTVQSKSGQPKTVKMTKRTTTVEPAATATVAANTGAGAGKTGTASLASAAAVGTGPAPAKIVPAALRLGLRYNLLLVDDLQSGRSHEVDPDGSFKTGDCFQVKLRPSRGGRMYVFNEGSSGNVHSLLPSALAPDEDVDVTAGNEVVVARDHCFKLDDRKGIDKLVILITDRPEDIKELDRLPSKPGSDAQLAMLVKPVFERNSMISRDMTIQKIGSRPEGNDPAHSVFIVKTAATDSDQMKIEISLKH